MPTQPEEINICQDCWEHRGRPTIIDYPTSPFIMCHDCNADTDLLAIKNPAAQKDTMHRITPEELAQFTTGYTEAAHWTGIAYNHTDPNGYDDAEPIDNVPDHETPDTITGHALIAIHTEALNVLQALTDNDHTTTTLATYATKRATTDPWHSTGFDAYLTAAGHGTGLWDQNIPEGDTLTERLNNTRHAASTLTLDTTTNTYHYEG